VSQNEFAKGGVPNGRNCGEIYRCEVCGMVVEVKEAGGGELVCCDQPMVKEN
jgi:desulfoferrodoxin-like iron-binding protein